MYDGLQTFVIGAAMVCDTVLLMALVERPNWRSVTVWMLLLALGVWLWHTGTFAHALLSGSTGPLAFQADRAAMIVMSAGLLLMPSALLHGLLRLWRMGLRVSPRPNVAYAFLYLPLIALIPVAGELASRPGSEYLELVAPFKLPYLCWMSSVNLIAGIGLLMLRRRIELPRAHEFFGWMTAVLLGMAAGNAFIVLYALDAWPHAVPWLQLATIVSPTLPLALFVYFVLRFRLLPLVLERTLVYGAIVVGLMLLHQLAVRDLATAVHEHYRVDFGILEGAVAIVLVLVYQPARQRVGEALRYLFRSQAASRGENRRLAVEMAARSGRPVDELLDWFVSSVQAAFRVEYAVGWVFDASGRVLYRSGETARLPDDRARVLQQQLASAGLVSCTRYEAPSQAILEILQQSQASVAVQLEHQQLAGLLLLGPQPLNQPPGDEELSSLVLLAEQLSVTMHNSILQEARLAWERQALQQEKLSTLGLLAGSVAHEVRNPLSSIKTITTMLGEDLGGDSPHAEDIRLILSEIDRLAATTSQLLEIARPERPHGKEGRVPEAVQSTLGILRHLARQQDVTIEMQMPEGLPAVCSDENALREIVFNLLANAVQAAGHGGRVHVSCRQENGCVRLEVRDNGPGIPAEVRLRLFEPFFTTRETGTGLGLYTVGRRVRDAGGEIRCESAPEAGTSFVVTLPYQDTGKHGSRDAGPG